MLRIIQIFLLLLLWYEPATPLLEPQLNKFNILHASSMRDDEAIDDLSKEICSQQLHSFYHDTSFSSTKNKNKSRGGIDASCSMVLSETAEYQNQSHVWRATGKNLWKPRGSANGSITTFSTSSQVKFYTGCNPRNGTIENAVRQPFIDVPCAKANRASINEPCGTLSCAAFFILSSPVKPAPANDRSSQPYGTELALRFTKKGVCWIAGWECFVFYVFRELIGKNFGLFKLQNGSTNIWRSWYCFIEFLKFASSIRKFLDTALWSTVFALRRVNTVAWQDISLVLSIYFRYFLLKRENSMLFDILQRYWARSSVESDVLFINGTVFFEQNARTTSRNCVHNDDRQSAVMRWAAQKITAIARWNN